MLCLGLQLKFSENALKCPKALGDVFKCIFFFCPVNNPKPKENSVYNDTKKRKTFIIFEELKLRNV